MASIEFADRNVESNLPTVAKIQQINDQATQSSPFAQILSRLTEQPDQTNLQNVVPKSSSMLPMILGSVAPMAMADPEPTTKAMMLTALAYLALSNQARQQGGNLERDLTQFALTNPAAMVSIGSELVPDNLLKSVFTPSEEGVSISPDIPQQPINKPEILGYPQMPQERFEPSGVPQVQEKWEPDLKPVIQDFKLPGFPGKPLPNFQDLIIHSEPTPTEGKVGVPKESTNPLKKSVDNVLIGNVRTGEKAQSFWKPVYEKAIEIPHNKILEMKEGKLEGIATIHLTKNCQRKNFIKFGKEQGIIPKDAPEEACYGGSCYKDRTQYNRYYPETESVSEKQLEFASEEGIRKMLSNPKNVERLNSSPFIRAGKAGDDSHAIAMGVAEKWLRLSKEYGVTKPTVFVESGYAPTTKEMYQKLAPYKDKFVIHITESGYFTPEEIVNRMNEFDKAKSAGLTVKMRVITNKDEISHAVKKDKIESVGAMKTTNEPFLLDLIKQRGIKNNLILETPYHNDFLAGKRSEPTGEFNAVCCETGKCASCKVKCLTGKC